MIGIFIDGIRIGSIMHFRHQGYWVAFSYNETKEKFKTRKEAVAWLAARHSARDAA